MSDWEDESDGEDTPMTNNFDEEENEFSDEEDETMKEIAAEKEAAKVKAKANKPKKTFDEIMADRKTKDAQKQLAEQRKEEAERQLSPEEQAQTIRDGLKAAEEADNALMNELLGIEKDGKDEKVAEDPEALEKLTTAISQLTLSASTDYSALSSALISKLRSDGGTSSEHLGGFLETLLSEIVTVQIADQLGGIGEVIKAAKSTAEALEAAKPKVVVEETKTKAAINKHGRGDKLVGMFDSMGLGGEDNDDDDDEDSSEEEEEEEEDFM